MGEGGFLKTKKLVDFQAQGVITAYLRGDHMLVWDAGTGKSVGAMALAVLCFQDDQIDQVLVICEKNKVREWVEDFTRDTDLEARKHHGSGRQSRLERLGVPRVLVTTYETAKIDLTVRAGPRKLLPGKLLDELLGKRVLVIYDESTKLRNRSSGNYKSHEYVLRTMRRVNPGTRVLALTATPIEKDFEDGFNQLRLVRPKEMPLVKEWEETCVRYRDVFGRPVYNTYQTRLFMESIQPFMTRKRKTDPDVIEQFPPLTEDYRYVEMHTRHRQFYAMVERLAFEEGEDTGAWMTLRQVAGHPASIIHSARRVDGSKIAKVIVDTLGEEHIRSIPCTKADELVDYLSTIVHSQGAKAMVFTFFGRSVLRCLEEAFVAAEIPVFTYHGEKSGAENEYAKDGFKNHHGGAVLLSSDSGARGINVPEATYVIEAESALNHAMRVQRINRAHRINSALGPVTAMTFITEGTVEEDIFTNVLRRNADHDQFVGDIGEDIEEEFVSASDRRMILQIAKERYENRRVKT